MFPKNQGSMLPSLCAQFEEHEFGPIVHWTLNQSQPT